MQYHELTSPHKKSKRRVGRGIAAGQGKTAGRGTKGQGSRTGSSKRPGFEGGQNPLMQRLPKLRGFRSFKTPAVNVYTDQLAGFGSKINTEVLAAKGEIESPYVRVKLLFRGEITKPVTVELQAASLNAIEAVQKAGGSFKAVPRLKRPAKVKEEK
jgi:large subunit ribosomal protein L15